MKPGLGQFDGDSSTDAAAPAGDDGNLVCHG
jgi:hypothetical protein